MAQEEAELREEEPELELEEARPEEDPKSLRVSELSDKFLQKLIKVTSNQIELCKQTCDDLDKCC